MHDSMAVNICVINHTQQRPSLCIRGGHSRCSLRVIKIPTGALYARWWKSQDDGIAVFGLEMDYALDTTDLDTRQHLLPLHIEDALVLMAKGSNSQKSKPHPPYSPVRKP